VVAAGRARPYHGSAAADGSKHRGDDKEHKRHEENDFGEFHRRPGDAEPEQR